MYDVFQKCLMYTYTKHIFAISLMFGNDAISLFVDEL